MMTLDNKVDAGMLSQLQELLGTRFGELVDRFIGDGSRRMELLRTAVVEKDYEAIHAQAHGLKGSSRNMGANGLGDICGDLEERGRTSDGDNLPALFAALEQEFAAVCQCLRGFAA